jgi:Mu transposase, C-terminal domain
LRLDANDYSVHPSVVGRRVDITADLHRVVVVCEGRQVAGLAGVLRA